MLRQVSCIPTAFVLVALFLAAPSSATPVVVPDDYPTIQAALDAGADSIQVRDGVTPEDVVITHDGSAGFSRTIEAATWGYYVRWTQAPRMRSLRLAGACATANVTVSGFRFVDSVELDLCGGNLVLDNCRFDQSFRGPNRNLSDQSSSIRACLFLGEVHVASGNSQFIGNTVIGSSPRLESSGVRDARNNYVPAIPDGGSPAERDLEVARRSLGSAAGPRTPVGYGSAGIGTVIVPDHFSSIQAAIDANADVVQVRDGVVPEDLVLHRDVTIEPAESVHGARWLYAPSIRSLRLEQPADGYSYQQRSVRVRGIRFLGPVDVSIMHTSLALESCRLDSGLVGPGSWYSRNTVRRCLIFGDVRISGSSTQFLGNTVIGGKTYIWSDGSHDIRDNFILGPADAGLDLRLHASGGSISGNTISGTVDGIRVQTHPNGGNIDDNHISNCKGDGIVSLNESNPRLNCVSNVVENCGGAGIAIRVDEVEYRFSGMASLIGNVIRNCGQEGVRLENSYAWPVRNNVILDCGGDGFIGEDAPEFEYNVIGRNGGVGLQLNGSPSLHHNTIFSNAGGGVKAWNGYFTEFTHNIFAFNGGHGLVINGPHPAFSSCNNWFGNAAGNAIGALLDATETYLDPTFCGGVEGTAGHLAASSPLLTSAVGYCGLIGALGQGCAGPTTAVTSPGSSLITTFRASPVPSRGAVTFSLPVFGAPADLEIFDITGARRCHFSLPAGTANARWDRQQSNGGTAPPGVYFARLRQDSKVLAHLKVILTE